MRKRLIGKAFAIAMSGAMVLTATPVTANIFNVAHIVKAADDAQQDEWTYCYVGLTWAEYWANEGVYNANDTSSSDVEDSHYEKDKGGYDVVQLQITDFTEEVSKEMQSLKQKLLMIPQKNFLFLTGVKMVKNSINHPQMLQV